MNKHHLATLNHYPSRYVDVLGSKMHFIESGGGLPILFLHGIPTSCYLWRQLYPYLSSLGRCIAPDLIGFGKSDKPDIAYTAQDHIRYVNGFIKALDLKHLIIVMHGFGSVPGLEYALSHEKNCRGLVFYEAFIRPMQNDNVSLPYQEQTVMLAQKLTGTDMLTGDNDFIGQLFSQAMISEPSDAMLAIYREPFTNKNAIKPVRQYLKEAPSGNGHSAIDRLLETLSTGLTKSILPKLLLYSIPGFVTTMATIMWAKSNLKHLEIIDAGEELHYGTESSPDLIGKAISAWLQAIEQSHSERAK